MEVLPVTIIDSLSLVAISLNDLLGRKFYGRSVIKIFCTKETVQLAVFLLITYITLKLYYTN